MSATTAQRPRRRPALAVLGIVIAAAITGALSTKPLLFWLMEQRAVHNGPWRTSASTGSVSANPWERATVALAGLYALTPQEAVYFTAFRDSHDEPLRGGACYRVQGQPPPSRWWSLTVYGEDHYLVPNAQNLYARHASNLPAQADGGFVIDLAARPSAERGLPIPQDGPFSLTLRVYNPAPAVLAQLATVPLPTITREPCP